MINRERYIKQIREFYDCDLIKIITGIRRCGKSIILNQIMEEIKQKTNNIIYLNFEDINTQRQIYDDITLLKYIEENTDKQNKYYLFFDEIQTIENWQVACKTLRLYNYSIFITGSNSKLLSSEFVKELSGRYVAFRVRPFVYKEIVEYCNQLNKEPNIMDYLIYGGFPKRFEFESKDAQLRYLNDLDDTIVINDLVRRYKIRKENLFKQFVNYVLRSNARVFSVKSIHDYIKNNYASCSINTIMNYLKYLEDAYIIESVKQYSTKTKKELEYYVKIYNEDVSLNSIRCLDNKFDITHNLENVIYNELKFMGYQVNVFNNAGKEIDFLAQKNNKQYYIQVAYSVAEEKAYNREFDAFKNLDNLSQKIIITNDEIDYSTSTVKHIKLKDFLQMENLDDIISL
ncbi:MAG: ATP-binding protein [Clostridia bacterium]|nr:ATP-binding protein [Clostridia bacterium]MBQ8750000.1 ATP-binding protein [Clostridia bacterium]